MRNDSCFRTWQTIWNTKRRLANFFPGVLQHDSIIFLKGMAKKVFGIFLQGYNKYYTKKDNHNISIMETCFAVYKNQYLCFRYFLFSLYKKMNIIYIVDMKNNTFHLLTIFFYNLFKKVNFSYVVGCQKQTYFKSKHVRSPMGETWRNNLRAMIAKGC